MSDMVIVYFAVVLQTNHGEEGQGEILYPKSIILLNNSIIIVEVLIQNTSQSNTKKYVLINNILVCV